MPHRLIRTCLAVLGTILFFGPALAQGTTRLVVSLAATPPHLDVMSNTTAEVTEVGHHIFETLFSYDDGFRPQPMLAESYAVEDDGRAWTVTLRRGVLFHDGEEMTSADVAASFARWTLVSNIGRSYADAVFEILDAYRFRITTSTPRADFLDSASDISQSLVVLPAAIASAAGAEPLTDPSQWIGTGPFEFANLVPDQSIVLRAFANYTARNEAPSGHGGGKQALVDEVEWRIISDLPTRTAALRSGEIDIIPAGISGADKPVLESDPAIAVQVITGFQKWGPMFNGQSFLMSDPLMRMAVAYALDHEELALAMVTDQDLFDLNPGLAFRGSFYYSEAGAGAWNQNDPERVRALLAEAGYSGTEIVIVSTKSNLFQDRMATVLEAQLRDAGMNVRVDWYDGATLREVRTQPDRWDIIPGGWSGTFNPAIFAQAFTCDSGSWAGICEPRLDELFATASATVDLDARKLVFAELQAIMHERYVPMVYIGDFMALRAHRTNLEGVRPFKDFRAWGVTKR